jgi:hypothetical protein
MKRLGFRVVVVLAACAWPEAHSSACSFGHMSIHAAESVIQQRLLEACPLGSSQEEVTNALTVAGTAYTVSSKGFLKQPPESSMSVVGVTSIMVDFGAYRAPPLMAKTAVVAYWGFDNGGKLVEVWVWKTADAP